MSIRTLILVGSLGALAVPVVSAGELVLLDDFESGSAPPWEAAGGGIVRSAEAARTGSWGASWTPEEGGKIVRAGVPADWRVFRSLRFEIRAHPGGSALAERSVRVAVREQGGRHAWLRRVRVLAGVWTEVEIPLWLFRQVGSPRWERIAGIEIYALEAGPIDLDDLRLVGGEDGLASHSLPDDLALEIAFPDRPWTRTARRRGPFRVLTDCPAADLDALLDGIEAVYADFRTLFGIEEPPPAAPFDVYLFDAPDRYRRLFPILVETLHSAILAPPESDGISIFYSAASSHEPSFPGGRPVLFHEATHTFVAYHLRVPSEGGWLQEGVATLLQNRRARQADLDDQVRKMLEAPNHVTLARLFESERMRPGALYLQSMAFVEFLLDGSRRGGFPRFVEGWRAGRETPEIAAEVLGLSGDDLDAAWHAWVEERYRKE